LRLLAEKGLELAEVVAGGELMEGFARVAVGKERAEHFFQSRLELLDGDALENLAADGAFVAETATDHDVISLLRFASDFHLGA
jgi:hypothetical protein